MRKIGQDASEHSTALYLLGLEGTAEPSGGVWEHDVLLLNSLAYLSETKPYNLLRKISWSVGEHTDPASFHEGRPLSTATRTRLQAMLKERLRVEEETHENCRHASAQIAWFGAFLAGFAIVASLMLR
jgi:hypothetical protein